MIDQTRIQTWTKLDVNGYSGGSNDPNYAIYTQPVEPGKQYTLTGTMSRANECIASFFKDGDSWQPLGVARNDSTKLPFPFTVPAGAAFVKIMVMVDGVNTTNTMSLDPVPTTTKKLLALGDSVTQFGYWQKVLMDAGISVETRGYPGSMVSHGFDYYVQADYKRPSILDMALTLNPSDYSGVIVMAGFNDQGYSVINGHADGVVIGDATSDEKTFVGAFKMLLGHFIEIPRFVINTYRRRDDRPAFGIFAHATCEVSAWCNVPCFDIYNRGWSALDAHLYLTDDVHINETPGGQIVGNHALNGYNFHIKPFIA